MDSSKQYRNSWMVLLVMISSFSFAYQETTEKKISATLLTTQKEFVAGERIILAFRINDSVTTQLYLQSSWGSTLITSAIGRFEIPAFIAQQKGSINYTLFYDKNPLIEGAITIHAYMEEPITVTSYIGPPSITAGGHDFTMQTVIPTDIYDNPIKEDTPVVLKHQFLQNEKRDSVVTKDMVAWKRHYSYSASGRILLSAKVKYTVSKEFSVEVFPALPLDFEIKSYRKHTYADGNQVVDFKTSILRDIHGNVISDGTLVTFVIKNSSGVVLTTQGMTINGQAIAKMIHPDHKEHWIVTAYVQGIAESIPIEISFTPVTDDFPVVFAEKHRKIQVGPLVSFMGQLIPDGVLVKLQLYDQTRLIDTKISSSKDGMAIFLLPEEVYPSATYRLSIEALGIEKEYKEIVLE